MAFDKPTRNRLQKFVAESRGILTDEFTRQMQATYGIDPKTGSVADAGTLSHLDNRQRDTARLLREALAHYLAGQIGSSQGARTKQSLERMVREQAFTVLNRLAALRMAEARGFLLESVAKGHTSKGFQLYRQLAGGSLGETGDAYRAYLFSLFDEFTADLAVLFDRHSTQSLLFPRDSVLNSLLDLLNAPDLEALWAEDETIGWIYQYYNDPDERKKMRKESAAPRNSRELAVRNQFFTPRYVVEFLTDNTLGRIWYEMTRGQTRLADQCRYLVRRPTEIFLAEGESAPETPDQEGLSQEELLKQPVHIPHRPLKDPREIRLLDPACGSMHFGLYAFDLFETIYEEAWDNGCYRALQEAYPGKDEFLNDVPRLIIEHNIHGIDIDPRAVQIAGLSLWLRAQKAWQVRGFKRADRPRVRRSNIVCAEPMPGSLEMLQDFAATLDPPLLGELVKTVFDKMQLAGEVGSLLKIEEEIRNAIDTARKDWFRQQGDLFSHRDGTQEEIFDVAEQQVIDALRAYAEQADASSYQRRLFADDAARGFAFIDLCRKRYDAIVMNPPFGLPSESSKPYLFSNYPDSKEELLTAFLSRFESALNADGRIGCIGNRTIFYLTNHEAWRNSFFGSVCLSDFVDLGFNVLDAVVEVAAHVSQRTDDPRQYAIFIRCLSAVDKESSAQAGIASALLGSPEDVFCHRTESFRSVPGFRFSYFLPDYCLTAFERHPSLLNSGCEVYVGAQTSDNFRFLRLAWEVPLSKARDWPPFAKGGEYESFWGDLHLCCNWQSDGAELKAWASSLYGGVGHWSRIIHHPDRYFLPGLTYSRRTASAFSPRILPANCIFGEQGPSIQTTEFDHGSVKTLLALMYSRSFRLFIEALVAAGDSSTSGTAARTYERGVIGSIPVPQALWGHSGHFESQMNICIDAARRRDSLIETSRFFSLAPISASSSLGNLAEETVNAAEDAILAIVNAYSPIEKATEEIYHLHGSDLNVLDLEIGARVEVGGRTLLEEATLSEAIALSEQELIERLKESGANSRSVTAKYYLADRRLELAANLFQTTVPALIEGRRRLAVVREADNLGLASALLSTLVGSVFGRWDIRYATRERQPFNLPDPFDPLPVCPPGMLQNAAGMPAEQKDVPADYPLRISWTGILVDELNHPEDIAARIREGIEAIWSSSVSSALRAESIEQEACEILGVKSLRDYFQRPAAFFTDHLKRYSKSRRQAPIYWPLSTKSGSYTLWLYYHRLTEQTLYACVNDFVEPKIKSVAAELAAIRVRLSQTAKEEKEFARLTDLEVELNDFRDELLRVAKFWKPNLHDGVQISAAPLWSLFGQKSWQNTLKGTWKELENGDYDWSHLACSIWPERVLRKCHQDRSLAIAHGVEAEFWSETEVTAKATKKSQGVTKTECLPKKLSSGQLDELVRRLARDMENKT